MDEAPISPEKAAEFAEAVAEVARKVAREEIASLAGLTLRRLQDMGPTRSMERNMQVEILAELWGEVLRDFGGTPDEPGPDDREAA